MKAGMGGTDKRVPEALLARVVEYFQPRRVVLFGSHARGTSGPDSDYDLLVIVDDDTAPSRLTLRAGWEARRGFNGAVDVIPVRERTFNERAGIPGTLAYEAKREGIAVYERS